jgi:hypothetical protein
MLRLLTALLALALLAGCESLSETTSFVRGRLAAREEVKERSYPAAPRVVYDAVRAAVAQMGYRVVRGGPAQGEIDAVSAVGAGEQHGSARQIALKVKLRAALDGGGTVVAVSLTEILEPDSSNRAGQATGMPLRDTPQYQVLFQRIAELLAAPEREAKKAVDAG